MASGMGRQILKMLHRVNKPELLAAMPGIDSICRQMGSSNPRSALEKFVYTALPGDDSQTVALRASIFDADFKRLAGNGELAQRQGISRRHFQRRRARAVAAIVGYSRTLSGYEEVSAEATIPARESWRFRRELAAFLAARDRGNALEMRCIARNLLRLAESERASALARSLLCDANARLGAHEERARCRPLPDSAIAHPRRRWDRFAEDVEKAGCLARRREWNRARSVAARSWYRCERRGFGGLSAAAAAVLAAVDEARGDRAGAQLWRARAIERLLPTQDRLLAGRLFPQPAYGRRHRCDRLLRAVLYERLTLIVPQMLGETPRRRATVESWLATVVDAAILGDCGRDDLARARAVLARSDCVLVRQADKMRLPVAEMLALAVVALTGRSWNTAFAAVDQKLAMSPAIAVSQIAVAEHLKVNVRRSERDGGPIEDLTDLRVRILSLRPGTGAALERQDDRTSPGAPDAAAGLAHSL
jgi:hypothetical protein